MLKQRFICNSGKIVGGSIAQGNAVILDATFSNYSAAAVRVDNYSGKWLLIESENIFIPPFTAGYVVDLFVQTRGIRIRLQQPASLIGTQVLDGDVIVSSYEKWMLPDTGTRVGIAEIQAQTAPSNSAFAQSQAGFISAGEIVGLDYSLNQVYEYFGNGGQFGFSGWYGPGWRAIPGMTVVRSFVQAVTAVYSALSLGMPYAGIATPQMLMFSFSVDVSGLVEFQMQANNDDVIKQYCMAMTPYTLPIPDQGASFNNTQNVMRVRNDAGASNIAITTGWGP